MGASDMTLAQLAALAAAERVEICRREIRVMRERHERETTRHSAEIINLADLLAAARARRLIRRG